jgi:glycosyltransferase involved in cell wall biosynthesis
LVLSATAEIGGTERMVLTIAKALVDRRAQVDVVFPEADGTRELLDWFEAAGVHARGSPAARSIYQSHSLRDMLRLRRLVRDSGATVVNLHYGGNHISLKDVVVTRLAGSRCIVQVHHAEEIEEGRKRRMTGLAGWLATAVVVTTPVLRDLLLRAGVPAARIRIIPCGVPVPGTRPTREQARAALGLPAGAFVVGGGGRRVGTAGMVTLIEAVASLPDAAADVQLAIAGEGPERQTLFRLGTSLLGERFRLLGRIDQPEDLYMASDVFALASREEGFGLVFIEAALHGVPSVAMDVGGVRYAIRHGETGLLAPLGDRDAFSAAIQRFRADAALRRRLGEAACTYAEREFTVDAMAARYSQLLHL